MKVLGMVTPGPSEWLCNYDDKGLKRDDVHWKTLFVISNSLDFNMSNLWKLFSIGVN